MAGHWTGIFSYKNGVTSIDFTGDVTAKKSIYEAICKNVFEEAAEYLYQRS